MRAVLQVLLNALGLWLTAQIVPGVVYEGGPLGLLLAGLAMGLVNLLVRPLAILLSLPFILLTLGLFFMVINGAMLALAATVVPGLAIQGCLPALLGGFVLALFNWLVRAFEAA
jgi:putative membrane protein